MNTAPEHPLDVEQRLTRAAKTATAFVEAVRWVGVACPTTGQPYVLDQVVTTTLRTLAEDGYGSADIDLAMMMLTHCDVDASITIDTVLDIGRIVRNVG